MTLSSFPPQLQNGRGQRAILLRVFLILGFVAVGLFSIAWWRLMPKGFPAGHVRFWVNSVLPPVAAAASLLGIVAACCRHEITLKCLTSVFACAFVGAGITAKLLFPESMSGLKLGFVAGCSAAGVLPAWLTFRRLRAKVMRAWLKAACICAGAAVGILVPWSQRGADCATRPCNLPLPPSAPALVAGPAASLPMSDEVTVFPRAGVVSARRGGSELQISPLLSFQSRSPDRFWTIFAPRLERRGPARSLVGLARETKTITMEYADDGRSFLTVGISEAPGPLTIESFSHLPRPVYSHLNSFCRLLISGQGALALSFSPCPGVVRVTPSDYPVGRPRRLAYLDANNKLRVVEARSGEKGPFTTLTEGRLGEDEPLLITVYHGKTPAWRVTLDDWARQASRQLSPTAGWNLPENAIEFCLTGSGSAGEGVLFITLAGTSVGRGWDSVGHAAGTYRNRITIQAVSGRAEHHAQGGAP